MYDKLQTQNCTKPLVKVWCDGCYDLVHFGHANSLRQAKALGDYLVVGVHTDEDISKHKGPPVFTFEERCQMVAAIKWVDEVVKGSPYVTTLEVLDQYDCDFCCHGDDVTVTDSGEDTYQEIKAAGRYREVQRTAGVSTTGLVERILRLTLGKNVKNPIKSPWTGTTRFYLTTERIVQFSNRSSPKSGNVVVYVCGGFDLFHVGHVKFLEKAREQGDYLIVGLYSDQVINQYKGGNYPIMTVHERLLSLLACKHVSEVAIEAPLAIGKELIDTLKIDIVAGHCEDEEIGDIFKYPKAVNKFVRIDSERDVTSEKIIERIVKNRFEYVERNEKKERKEVELISVMQKNSA